MKRIIFFAFAVLIFAAIQFLANCSNPLESLDGNRPAPPGPITQIDTVIVLDTNVVVDTVIIIEPGSSEAEAVCSRIASNHPDIVWMFRNPEGSYLLEFDAYPESSHPPQTLSVNIDGREFLWTPANNAELVTELYLSERTIIKIMLHSPPALGHAIHICLKVSRLPD